MSEDKSPYFLLGVFGETIKFAYSEVYRLYLRTTDKYVAEDLLTVIKHLREAKELYEDCFFDDQ